MANELIEPIGSGVLHSVPVCLCIRDTHNWYAHDFGCEFSASWGSVLFINRLETDTEMELNGGKIFEATKVIPRTQSVGWSWQTSG